MPSKYHRREFIKIALSASGSLLVSFSLPAKAALSAAGAPPPARKHLNAWLEISTSNQFFLHLNRVELGQGVATALATLIGEELDVDPAEMILIHPSLDKKSNPDYRTFNIGASGSVRSSWKPMREAGAATRALLLVAASKKLGEPVAQLHTQNGVVISSSGARINYADLNDLAATLPQPAFVLKDASEYRYIGRHNQRLDVEAMVTGKMQYCLDVQIDKQVVAVIERAPSFGARPISFDARESLKVPGVYKVLKVYNGVAVLAQSYWQATKARQLLQIEWEYSSLAGLDDQSIAEQYKNASTSTGETVYKKGENDEQVASKVTSSQYSLPYLSHATMEPMNCTAVVEGGRCTVWAPTQSPAQARGVAATVAGLPESAVELYTLPIGGGFGRRLEQDYVAEAVYLAKRIERPVKVIWSREDDFKHGLYRPKTEIELSAKLSGKGDILELKQQMTGAGVLWSSIDSDAKSDVDTIKGQVKKYVKKFKREYRPNKDVAALMHGVRNKPYSLPREQVLYHYCHPGVPVGFWRSVGNTPNIFALEGCINEIAFTAKRDPLAYRKQLLQDNVKALRVLEKLAEISGWEGMPKGKGMALFNGYESMAALAVGVELVEGRVSVTHAYCVADCGMLINPDIAKAQLEGGIIFGLSAALYEQINIVFGGVKQNNFHDYPIMRMNQAPAISIELLDSQESPGGVGELSVPLAAPALCAAIMDVSGVAQRVLPIQPA